MPALGAGGREFESLTRDHVCSGVAQSVEQVTVNHCVVGSIPTSGASFAGLAQR